MQIENFKTFTDLVENQSFSKAAKLNRMTQSAVSQQLRALEKHFKVLVVDRSQKQFCLTREGEFLYEKIKDFLHLYEKMSSELLDIRKIIGGTIHISTVYSIGLHELPPYITRFLQDYPQVNIRVEYRRANNVYEDVIRGDVDIGLVAFPTRNKGIEIIPFQQGRLILVCRPDHLFAQKTSIPIEELEGQKVVGFDQDMPTRRATDAILREHDMNLDPVMEFDNIETVKRAVEIGAGIAIIPESTAIQEIKTGLLKAVPLEGDEFMRPLAILHNRSKVLTPAMRKFIDLLTTQNLINKPLI